MKKALAVLKIDADFVKAGCAYYYAERISTMAPTSAAWRELVPAPAVTLRPAEPVRMVVAKT